MTWVLTIAGVHLVNQNGNGVAGGSPYLWATTPFGVRTGWTPNVAKPITKYIGTGAAVRPVHTSYAPVEETIPITIYGNDGLDVATALDALKKELATANTMRPAIWKHRPVGALFDLYAEVYEGSVQERTNDAIGPIEGGNDLDAEIRLLRSPFFGTDEVIALITNQVFTNTFSGNVVALNPSIGSLLQEGQPLNIQINKPTAQTAETVYVATVVSRIAKTIASTQSTNTSTGVNFPATSAFDVSALRTNNALSLHLLARLSVLTLPTQAQLQATIKTAVGAILWQSSWRTLGSAAAAQLIDLGDAPLSMLRLPIANAAANITVTLALRSITGGAVAATLDYVEALLVYDFCKIEMAGGLTTGQHYSLFAAQNLSGGAWLPMVQEDGAAFDASEVQTGTIKLMGQLPRAFPDVSLYLAWADAGKAHTSTDTATVTVGMAPLWRSLRGVS